MDTFWSHTISFQIFVETFLKTQSEINRKILTSLLSEGRVVRKKLGDLGRVKPKNWRVPVMEGQVFFNYYVQIKVPH